MTVSLNAQGPAAVPRGWPLPKRAVQLEAAIPAHLPSLYPSGLSALHLVAQQSYQSTFWWAARPHHTVLSQVGSLRILCIQCSSSAAAASASLHPIVQGGTPRVNFNHGGTRLCSSNLPFLGFPLQISCNEASPSCQLPVPAFKCSPQRRLKSKHQYWVQGSAILCVVDAA